MQRKISALLINEKREGQWQIASGDYGVGETARKRATAIATAMIAK